MISCFGFTMIIIGWCRCYWKPFNIIFSQCTNVSISYSKIICFVFYSDLPENTYFSSLNTVVHQIAWILELPLIHFVLHCSLKFEMTLILCFPLRAHCLCWRVINMYAFSFSRILLQLVTCKSIYLDLYFSFRWNIKVFWTFLIRARYAVLFNISLIYISNFPEYL